MLCPEDACPKRFSWFFYWIPKVQKHINLVDLVKSFPTSIYLQNLASIQPRTAPRNSFSLFGTFSGNEARASPVKLDSGMHVLLDQVWKRTSGTISF